MLENTDKKNSENSEFWRSEIYFLKTILLASLKLTVSLSQIVSFSQVYFLFLLSMKNYFIINNDNNNNSTDNK